MTRSTHLHPCGMLCFFSSLVLAVLLAGCGGGDKPGGPSISNGDGKGGAAKSTGKPGDAPAEKLAELKGDVKLEVVDWDEVQKRVAAHKGKVVVLDIWSNYCDPCMKEFPDLVLLQRRYPDDVVAMSLNMNYGGLPPEGPTEEHTEPAEKFLKEKGAKIENYLSKVADEKFYETLGVTSVPMVLVYDREGKLDTNFNNDEKKYGAEFTYKKHIEPRVKELIAAKPAAGK
jgi:thiol-disulfide isomerase/thioredoxin